MSKQRISELFFSLLLFVSSSPFRWRQPAGLLHVEAARSTCHPVWPFHLNPPPIQSESLPRCLQRNHQSGRFPSGQHHTDLQVEWAPAALPCMCVVVQEQSHAGLWRLPPNNGHHVGCTCHLRLHHQKPKKKQREGGEQDEQEEKKGKSTSV